MNASLHLEPLEQAMLSGSHGPALAFALRLMVSLAHSLGAKRLIPITRAHIDGCLYHGQVSLDFVLKMQEYSAKVQVPTTLNVGGLDRIHPGRNLRNKIQAQAIQKQMDAYEALGCEATWTCAPYQLPSRPALGEQIAWAESNAIVFANSVLGARTNRYGDFTDLCAALTARVPEAGLHLGENRRGQVVYRLEHLEPGLLSEETLFPVLGHLIGFDVGQQIPVLQGLPPTTHQDQLKALGAAAASSGSVAMFHAVGLTPEAPTLEAALHGQNPERTVVITAEMLRQATEDLSGVKAGERISAVTLGTPHYSLREFEVLLNLLQDQRIHPEVSFYVNTSRHIKGELEKRGWLSWLEDAGIKLVLDTCTYVSPIMGPQTGAVMTSSAKCAYYAPGNLGVRVAFGSTAECVRSAIEGRVWRDEGLWA